MGYKNRTIRLDFEDLGDGVYVEIRNPRLMSADRLKPREIALDEQGRPKDPADADAASYEVMARLIVDWNVYDADDDSEDPPPLGAPDVDTVKKLPLEILSRLGQELEAVVPS